MATVDPNDVTRAALKNMLLGIDVVWLEAECSRYDFFPDVISQSQPDMALISLDADPEKALNLIQEIRQASPTISILSLIHI